MVCDLGEVMESNLPNVTNSTHGSLSIVFNPEIPRRGCVLSSLSTPSPP